jgi:hypothetical protein
MCNRIGNSLQREVQLGHARNDGQSVADIACTSPGMAMRQYRIGLRRRVLQLCDRVAIRWRNGPLESRARVYSEKLAVRYFG